MTKWNGDGKSFGQTLRKDKEFRKWIYCYYDSGKKQFPLSVFAQNKKYKLYRNGRFFNIEKDQAEKEMLDTVSLTPAENANRNKLKEVLTKCQE